MCRVASSYSRRRAWRNGLFTFTALTPVKDLLDGSAHRAISSVCWCYTVMFVQIFFFSIHCCWKPADLSANDSSHTCSTFPSGSPMSNPDTVQLVSADCFCNPLYPSTCRTTSNRAFHWFAALARELISLLCAYRGIPKGVSFLCAVWVPFLTFCVTNTTCYSFSTVIRWGSFLSADDIRRKETMTNNGTPSPSLMSCGVLKCRQIVYYVKANSGRLISRSWYFSILRTQHWSTPLLSVWTILCWKLCFNQHRSATCRY